VIVGAVIALVGWAALGAVNYLNTTVRIGNADALRLHRYKELGGVNDSIDKAQASILDTQRRDNVLRLELAELLTDDPKPFSEPNRLRYKYLSRELETDFDLIESEGRWLRYLQRRARFLGWHSVPVRE
jgi:hypothetical protein